MASLVKRGKTYYAQWRVAGRLKRKSLKTTSLQMAKERLRNMASRLAQGEDNPFPTRTPIEEVVKEYIAHIRVVKTRAGVTSDLWYLRELFGPICPDLQLPARKMKRRHIEANCFEAVTTAQVSELIGWLVRTRGYAPKTANRFREITQRLYNWAMTQRGIRMPADRNPAARVERYKERARDIRFLTLEQIDEQLRALQPFPQLQAMVAVYIYAGLRRQEALWLQLKDIDRKAGSNGSILVRNKTVDGVFWQPKTKVNRIVPISTTLRRYLDAYTPRIVPGHWFFASPQGHRWNPDNFSADLRNANKKAKLPWNCLDYRHTFGSHLAMKGESLYKIATLMGNSPEICRSHYARLLPEALESSVEFGNTAVTQ